MITYTIYKSSYFSVLFSLVSYYIHVCIFGYISVFAKYLWIFLVCVWVIVFVEVHVCVYLCVEGRGQPWVLFLRHCLSSYLKSLKLTKYASLAGQWAPRICCLHLHSTRITKVCYRVQSFFFTVGSWNQVEVSMLKRQVLEQLGYLPNPDS